MLNEFPDYCYSNGVTVDPNCPCSKCQAIVAKYVESTPPLMDQVLKKSYIVPNMTPEQKQNFVTLMVNGLEPAYIENLIKRLRFECFDALGPPSLADGGGK